MESLKVWSSRRGHSTGWKQAANVNCIVLASMSVTLVGCLIAATSQVGGIQKALFFYDGDCDEGNVSRVNMLIHLLINIISTLVVLNSPSREEVNAAHFRGSWLGIGVPSVRNAFHVSKFKTHCWVIFLLSSIPIHLLFNSAVFETDHRQSDYHLTIATEEFANGGAFYPPGASLIPAGGGSRDYDGPHNDSDTHYKGLALSGLLGAQSNLTDYANKGSGVVKNVSAAAMNAHRWERLSARECKQEYLFCSGLKHHRSVVLVIDKPGGWVRDVHQMWHFNDYQTKLWNGYVPPDRPNHLFFFSRPNNISPTLKAYSSALQPGTFDLSIEYCLAEPLDRICHIALSPTLLMGVTICVIVKTCTAIIVTLALTQRKQRPLVTLGDAMASFIEKPDPVTVGLCTFGQGDVRKTLTDKRIFLLSGAGGQWQPSRKRRAAVVPLSGSFLENDQNPFTRSPFTFFTGIMAANSPQLLLSFCYLAYNNLFTRLQMAREWALFSEDYRPLRVTDPQGEQYATYRLQLPYKYSLPLIAVSIFLHWLLSNTIYLFVSTGGYYGTEHFIIGAQVDPSLPPNTAIAVGFSTYSLLVLLIVSCVLLVIPILLSLKQLPPNMVNIGSNSFALSAACHVSVLSHATAKSLNDPLRDPSPKSSRSIELPTPLPFSTGRRRSFGEETGAEAGGDNFEMRQLTVTRQSSLQSLASRQLISDQDQEDSKGDERSLLFGNLARSKVRWGVVLMPPEWHSEYDHEGGVVEHLSFGVQEDDVQPPVPGRLYA
ncbi:hypothetical protein F4779DRAFT_625800 [Xylariaceae sp. FL0662B]|nr:hypothetical protein F4779DRAFT_625800 [Xylariaceae sp. FL0662B]